VHSCQARTAQFGMASKNLPPGGLGGRRCRRFGITARCPMEGNQKAPQSLQKADTGRGQGRLGIFVPMPSELPLLEIFQVDHLLALPCLGVLHNLPSHVRAPLQNFVSQMSVSLCHAGCLVGQEPLQGVEIHLARTSQAAAHNFLAAAR